MKQLGLFVCLFLTVVGCDQFKPAKPPKVHIEQGLFLIHAKAGDLMLKPTPRLVLKDVDKTVAFLIHEPKRRAGKMKLANFLDAFSAEFEANAEEPFSAAYIFYEKNVTGKYSETSIVLSNPDYSYFEGTLSFDLTFPDGVQIISPGAIDEVTLFIDAELTDKPAKGS